MYSGPLHTSLLTALGIGCSLLIAMLSFEYMLVGDFSNVLAYALISFTVAFIYLTSTVVSNILFKRAQNAKKRQSIPQEH